MTIEIPLSSLERKVTLALGNVLRNPRRDSIMIALSDPYAWIPYLIILMTILMSINWIACLQAMLLGGLAAGTADAINTRYIKPRTNRQRPYRQFNVIEPIGPMNHGAQSFPSNHASNTMSVCLAIIIFFPAFIWILIPTTLIIGISRVYCGAHFPIDVVGGWLHGLVWVFVYLAVSAVIL